jgi:hypothetical protein
VSFVSELVEPPPFVPDVVPPMEPPAAELPDEPELLDPVAAVAEDFVDTPVEPAEVEPAAPDDIAVEVPALDVVAVLTAVEAAVVVALVEAVAVVVALSVVTLAFALASVAVASVTAVFRLVVSSRASS